MRIGVFHTVCRQTIWKGIHKSVGAAGSACLLNGTSACEVCSHVCTVVHMSLRYTCVVYVSHYISFSSTLFITECFGRVPVSLHTIWRSEDNFGSWFSPFEGYDDPMQALRFPQRRFSSLAVSPAPLEFLTMGYGCSSGRFMGY